MNNLIDFHTHILPGIDDGSPDLTTSDAMLDALAKQGVETVILTPHFYSDSESLAAFLAKRDEAFALLSAHRGDKKPYLIPAAEVYYSSVLMNYNDLSPLMIGNSDYILLEMPFHSTFSEHRIEKLYQLMLNCNAKFIFAHINRYAPLIKDTYILDELLNLECLAQVNMEALTGKMSTRKKILRLLDSGRVFALGTDCHNLSSRAPDYASGLRIVEKKLGQNFIAQMTGQIYDALQL